MHLTSVALDPGRLVLSLRDGGNAVLVGVGANHSMKSGQAIKVQDLVSW